MIIAKNDLERHAHTLSGDAGADLRSQAGGDGTEHRVDSSFEAGLSVNLESLLKGLKWSAASLADLNPKHDTLHSEP